MAQTSGGLVRFDSDAAVSCSYNSRGLDMVCRDYNGDILLAKVKNYVGSFTAKLSEAFGILLAVKDALAPGFSRVKLESDSQKVINLIKSEDRYLFELGKIVEEIKSFRHGPWAWFSFEFCP